MLNSVKKRETFYIAGYDPRGARHYYNLYKKEAALQSKVNGMTMDISSRKRTDKHMQSWHIKSETGEVKTETNYHFLEWDDIIRKRWHITSFSIFADLYFYMKTYIFTGLIVKFGKLSPNQMAPAFFPVLFLLLTLLFTYFTWSFVSSILSEYINPYMSMIVAGIPAYLFLRLMIWIGNQIAVFWLLRIYVFCAQYVFEDMHTLDKRIDIFAKYIYNSIKDSDQNGIDEILISSHSVGTILVIPVMSKVLVMLGDNKDIINKVSILTLGECLALVSFLDEAKEFKSHMRNVSSNELLWLDYTAPIDGACFPLLDYYKHSGVEGKTPIYLSPRFHTLYDKKHYLKLKKDRYITHFLYLMATDIQGDYDYFKMTAGHKRLSIHHPQRNT